VHKRCKKSGFSKGPLKVQRISKKECDLRNDGMQLKDPNSHHGKAQAG
jgi:hypothetical protein